MKKRLLVLLAVFTLGCTDESGSRTALVSAGYSNIHLTGYRWFGCGEDDGYHTGFTATNPAGVRVSGVVCCGLMKGCTIRF